MDHGETGWEVDATGSESCPVGINISCVEYLNSAVLPQMCVKSNLNTKVS
jgi:hypothetical protein